MKQPRGHPYFFVAAVLLAAPCISPAQQPIPILPTDSLEALRVVKDYALKTIEKNYFEHTRIDTSLPIQEIIDRLDPFSSYFTKQESDGFMDRIDDEDYRFGIQIRSVLGHVLITSVLHGSPAYKAGMRPGDEIVTVDDLPNISDTGLETYLPNRDEVTFGIRRVGIDSDGSATILKGRFGTSSVPVASMVDSQVGYIALTGFHEGTASKLEKAVDRLYHCGMRALILDLRSNRGGLVSECLTAANLFVHSDGQTIIQNSIEASHIKQYSLGEVARYPNLSLAILVGNSSASASEMFSGILQDLDRAIIVGQPTVGKSLVMQFFNLPNRDRLYLAIAYYMLPSGRSVQRPYYNGDLIGGEDRDFGSFDNSAHVFDSGVSEADCPTYRTASGRSVIPFSGIVPDYFVSQDMFYPEWLRDAVEGAAALYLRVNAKWLLKTTIDSFESHCEISQPIIEWAMDSIRVQDTTSDKSLTAKLAWMVPKLIKADVASGIWDKLGFFKLWERNSATVRRAVELLAKPTTLALAGK
jgi:carboxyl-terminal processing protease